MMGYCRLGELRFNDCPAGARNRRKATVKMRRNPPLWILSSIKKKLSLQQLERNVLITFLSKEVLGEGGVNFKNNWARLSKNTNNPRL